MTEKVILDQYDTLLNLFRKKDQKRIMRYLYKAVRNKRREISRKR